ncbi:DUF4861 family protein [Rhodohalobacter sp. 8-1]|uniref:DUF4861 family protein n=1 Tax=Rhodohalobacter sp. 8-1 TaxID=3131972 RepID=UPI00403F5F5C
MGLILPSENYIEYKEAPNEESEIIQCRKAHLKASYRKEIHYYVTAGCELSNSNFTDLEYFFEYAETEMNHFLIQC